MIAVDPFSLEFNLKMHHKMAAYARLMKGLSNMAASSRAVSPMSFSIGYMLYFYRTSKIHPSAPRPVKTCAVVVTRCSVRLKVL